MNSSELKDLQAPLKEKYKIQPGSAMITLKAQGNIQEIMLGYSDSSKDGGYLAANCNLYQSQKNLFKVAEKHGIELQTTARYILEQNRVSE